MQHKLILRSHLSPGDTVLLTSTVRDLHRAKPNEYVTDVRTTAPQLWENNPYITPLSEDDPDVRTIEMHYPLINNSNRAPYHFIHGYTQYLAETLEHPIPVTNFKGDIHLSEQEKSWMSQVQETGFDGHFWIVMAGGKYDFTAKWWNPAEYQKVVDHFRGRIKFVQCGQKDHWHPPLKGVINFIGRTDTRQFVRLMYHAAGVISPITFAMHLAAAVETRREMPTHRACVVIAGGREPAQWEAYPHHQFISTNGMLDCCQQGGCWKSRCQPVDDSDPKNQNLCTYPVEIQPDLRIPRCMDMITAEDVIRRIEMYYEGGSLKYNEAEAEISRNDVLSESRDTWDRLANDSQFSREIETCTHSFATRNTDCDDEIILQASIDDNEVISEIAYGGEGCLISRASAALLCREISGLSVSEALNYQEDSLLQLLPEEVPSSKRRCALLGMESLRAMLNGERVVAQGAAS